MSLQLLLKENRFGGFRIATTHLFSVPGLREFLATCVIVRAERTFQFGDCVEYHAFCPDFEPATVGGVLRDYWAAVCPDGRVRWVELGGLPDGYVDLSEVS